MKVKDLKGVLGKLDDSDGITVVVNNEVALIGLEDVFYEQKDGEVVVYLEGEVDRE